MKYFMSFLVTIEVMILSGIVLWGLITTLLFGFFVFASLIIAMFWLPTHTLLFW